MSLPLLWAMIGQHTTFFFGGNWGIPNDYYWVFWLLIIMSGGTSSSSATRRPEKFRDSEAGRKTGTDPKCATHN
jgi:hypothetical protein